MKFFIGLGGLGCRNLHKHAKEAGINETQCFYLDADSSLNLSLKFKQFYAIPGTGSGSGAYRQIGKAIIQREIFQNHLYSFFENILKSLEVELILFTSSFGGFGSAAAPVLAEYLQNIFFDGTENKKMLCKIIAFNESCYHSWFTMSEELINRYRNNTLGLASELLAMDTSASTYSSMKYHERYHGKEYYDVLSLPIPNIETYLIDTTSFSVHSIHTILEKTSSELYELDVKKSYEVKKSKSSPPIFISYSSCDIEIVRQLVCSLENEGLPCWFAERNIKQGYAYPKEIMKALNGAKVFIVLISHNAIQSEHVKNEIDRAFAQIKNGLKILPFLIEDIKLDEELNYYLCRQEFFFGTVPPLHKKIEEFTNIVLELFED